MTHNYKVGDLIKHITIEREYGIILEFFEEKNQYSDMSEEYMSVYWVTDKQIYKFFCCNRDLKKIC